jgi:hypothetical protein
MTYRYNSPSLAHEAVDILQSKFEQLNFFDVDGITELPWFTTIFGLTEQGENNMPYGWDVDANEPVSAISNDKNYCQVFFTHEGTDVEINRHFYTIGIYIWVDERKVSRMGRGQVLNALLNKIFNDVFDNNSNENYLTYTDYETSQTIDNNILTEGSPLVDSNFNPFKDHCLYAKITSRIPVDYNCLPEFQVNQKFDC